MKAMTDAARELVSAFIAHINAHEVDAVAALLCAQHRFIGSLGGVVCGREALRAGWRGYFKRVPDYRIRLARVLAQGAEVLVVGESGGTFTTDGTLLAENAWSTPAVFHALVQDGLNQEWQVYADNDPIRRCMQRGT
jgi:ketosteroid isomerase-like protein